MNKDHSAKDMPGLCLCPAAQTWAGSRAQPHRQSKDKEPDMTHMRIPPSQVDPGRSLMQSARVDAPTDADFKPMASLGIGFDAGVYRFEGYGYDRLADAVTYARLAARRQFGLTSPRR